MKIWINLIVTALILAGAAGQAQASQGGYLAEFEAIGDDPNYTWTRNPGYKAGGKYSSVGTPGEANVNFTFLTPGVPAGYYPAELEPLFELNALGPLAAAMTITGDTAGWGHCNQPCAWAEIKFTYVGDTPLIVGGQTYYSGANLLTAAPPGATPLSSSWDNAYWESDFLDLSELDSVWGFAALQVDSLPPLVIRDGGPAVDDFVGRFASGRFYAAVPEPQTWALLIAGFGLLGTAVRRQRALTLGV